MNSRRSGGKSQPNNETAVECLDAVGSAYLSWYQWAEQQCQVLESANSTTPTISNFVRRDPGYRQNGLGDVFVGQWDDPLIAGPHNFVPQVW
jgi:hypothetical protein